MKPSNYAVLGAIVLAGFGVALYVAAQPRARAVETQNCQTNLKIIGLAMLQYNRDYDEKYPPAANWADSLKPYSASRYLPKRDSTKSLFACPTTNSFYAFNSFYAQLNMALDRNPTDSPLVFEVKAGARNLSDTGKLWLTEPIHNWGEVWGNNVLFADGHVKLMASKPNFRALAPSPQPTATPKPRVGNQKQL